MAFLSLRKGGEMSYEKRRMFFENLKILVKSEFEEVFRILKYNYYICIGLAL